MRGFGESTLVSRWGWWHVPSLEALSLQGRGLDSCQVGGAVFSGREFGELS